MDLLRIIKVVRRRRLVFFGLTLLAFIAVALAPRHEQNAPIVYTATSKILVTESSNPTSGNTVSEVPVRLWFADQVTLRELITSEKLLKRVVKATDSKQDWLTLRSEIDIRPLSEETRSIYIVSVTAPNGNEAVNTADALVNKFVDYVQELSSEEYASTRRYLDESIEMANQRIAKAEARLMALQARLPTEGELDLLSKQRLELEAENQQIRNDVRQLEQEAGDLNQFVAGQTRVAPWKIMQQDDPGLTVLASSLAEEKRKLIDLKKIYTDGNPQVIEQEQRVAAQEALYLSQVSLNARSLLQSTEKQIDAKTAAVISNTKRIDGIVKTRVDQGARLKLERARRELENETQSYEDLVKQRNQARLAELASRRQGAITILEQPLGANPSGGVIHRGKRERLKELAMTLPLCLLVGVIGVLLLDYLESSMRLQPRIEEAMELPVLAVIPELEPELVDRWRFMKQEAVMARHKE